MCESIGHRPLWGRCPKRREKTKKKKKNKKKKKRKEEKEKFPLCVKA